MPSFKAAIQLPGEKGYSPFITVPPDIYRQFDGKKPARVVVNINAEAEWKAGLMSLGNGAGFIVVSKRLIREFDLQTGKIFTVQISADNDEETWPMPEELKAVLELDDEARSYYEQLSDGKKRSITVFINQTKSAQPRVDKAILIADNLHRFKGKATVQQLFKKPV